MANARDKNQAKKPKIAMLNMDSLLLHNYFELEIWDSFISE
jgi:hypothetical protein